MRGTAEACWRAKGHLLGLISERISRDVVVPTRLWPSTVGTTFTPVIDLAVESVTGYGWVPQGIADESTPDAKRLRRGTRVLFIGGEQEQCPGGPGENILHLTVEDDESSSPRGKLVISYDLRDDFGANLGEHVLVRDDEPVLSDPDRLAAIAEDIARLIAVAPAIAFGWR
jgi:hypothetical protein